MEHIPRGPHTYHVQTACTTCPNDEWGRILFNNQLLLTTIATLRLTCLNELTHPLCVALVLKDEDTGATPVKVTMVDGEHGLSVRPLDHKARVCHGNYMHI